MNGRPNRRNKAAFSNSSGLKRVFVQLRFRDGLVRTVGLTVEIKLHFQNSPAKFTLRTPELASARCTFSSPFCLHMLYDFYS